MLRKYTRKWNLFLELKSDNAPKKLFDLKTKRIFIDNTQLSNWRYRETCFLSEIKNDSDSIRISGIGLIPTDVAKTSATSIISYYAGEPKCVDCTFRGTNIKPAFWKK